MTVSFDLEQALRRFPLPDDMKDETINRRQCAVALDVSEPMVTRYLGQGLPVLSKGTNGQAYEFQLSEVYAWKLWRDAETRAHETAAEAAAIQMRMLFRNDDEADHSDHAMSAEQIAKEADADYKRNRAAELRGELVRRARVSDLFEEVLIEFRTQVTSLVDFAEMEFALTPEQVDKMQRRCDAALISARQNFVRSFPEGAVTTLEAPRSEAGRD